MDDVEGEVFRPDWPVVDVIAGNPPFLGGKMQRRVLGEVEVDRLFAAYEGRGPREADLVCTDHPLIVIARDDRLTFGVLHSRWHEEWSLRLGSWLGVGNDPRYTPTTTFETFPFPDAAPGSP